MSIPTNLSGQPKLHFAISPAVENGPGDLPGVPLQHVRLVGAGGQELVALAISLDLKS